MTILKNIGIEDVRKFWDSNPLFVNESQYKPGTLEFFEEHKRIYITDCFAGNLDRRIFNINKESSILDLGCGPGFWTIEFCKRGFKKIVGADLSNNSLQIAKERAYLYNVASNSNVTFVQENAEKMNFPENSFDHVNCQGVIHHTPNPENAIMEIHRVLKDNGTALISVYYKNSILKNWPLLRQIIRLFKPGLQGRGRENIYQKNSINEIVRMYDGALNPLGIAFSKGEFEKLLSPFQVCDIWYGFFPARSLKIKIPKFLHKVLSRAIPFMIFANVRK